MSKPRVISIAVFLASITTAISVQAQSVHSAAGVLPSQKSTPTAQAATYAMPAAQRSFQREETRSAPPLPSAGASSIGPQSGTAGRSPAGASTRSVSAADTRVLATPSFEDALAEDVTIDVVDMALEDFIQELAPHGWRVRFQHVSQSVKQKRVDYTGQEVTRRDVLYSLLGDAGLSLQPFDGFDTPLLLITSHQ